MNIALPRKAFITATEVAAMLEIRPAQFRRKRPLLEAAHEFPLPMPFSDRPLRWRAGQVLAWIEEQGLPRAATAALPQRPTGPNVILLEEARRP
jgi:predicted DNA-binding transcriptional regulator AlpA